MFRSFALFCIVAVFSFSAAFSQDSTGPVKAKSKATPEILSLFDESFQSLAQVEPSQRADAFIQLLGFALLFEDKAPAKRVLNALGVLATTLESEEHRNRIYGDLAQVCCELEEYAEAAGVLQRIVKSADRYKSQLDIAVKIMLGHEQDKTLKPFDASELIRQAIGGAVEAQDRSVESFARALLGRELARQGKQEESVAAFAEAIRTAKGLEMRDQMRVIQVVVPSQVLYGQIEGAKATSQAIDAPEIKQEMTGMLILSLIENEKYSEAENLIKTFPAESGRDGLIQQWVVANAKAVTDAKIGELSALVSEEQRERFLQLAIVNLQKSNRSDVATQVSKRAKDTTQAELALFIGKVESLSEEKRFADAVQFIDQSKQEDAIRQYLKRQILSSQFENTHEEAIIQQIAGTYSNEEKAAIAELREEAAQSGKIADSAERLDTLFEILQEQFQIMDVAGARQTMKLVAEQLVKETDLIQVVQSRLLLARLQIELRDKSGVLENLGKLMQVLDVKDLAALKGLVPEQPAEPAPQPSGGVIKLDLPVAGKGPAVDESAIRNQLFQVYARVASLLAEAKAPVESLSALEKAKALAKPEPAGIEKAAKLLFLAQVLVEDQIGR